MPSLRILPLAMAMLLLPACYHATVDTGLAPSGETISKPWAHSFIAGLVPPSVVETASQCPNGVAKVETQLSFLNQLANFITFGLYSPMTITVQCAAQRTTNGEDAAAVVNVPGDATTTEKTDIVRGAAQRSLDSGEPVLLLFE